MNIRLRPLALIIGCIAGVLAVFTVRVPVICILIAVAATIVTDVVLGIQEKK